ncbi:hypothetical protein D5S17_32950 [Pseudonocardiaceae bacterium YIM PH 21723]|nr:hypothetical protein D5S17_32950 [Pseudonocardiaceae bacterium YIM PH 21723]
MTPLDELLQHRGQPWTVLAVDAARVVLSLVRCALLGAVLGAVSFLIYLASVAPDGLRTLVIQLVGGQ